MNGSGSGRMTATARDGSAATSSGAGSCAISRPADWRPARKPEPSSADHSSDGDAVDLPIQDAVAAEDESARVAPGTRIRLGLGGGHSWLLTSAAASGAAGLAAAEAIHEAPDLVAQHERGGDERGDHRLDREAARTGVDVGEDDVHQQCLNEFW